MGRVGTGGGGGGREMGVGVASFRNVTPEGDGVGWLGGEG